MSLVYFFSNKKKILKNKNKVFEFNLRNMNEIFICSHNFPYLQLLFKYVIIKMIKIYIKNKKIKIMEEKLKWQKLNSREANHT